MLIKYLNVSPEPIKVLEESIDSVFFDIGLSNIFSDMSLLARETEAKLSKWDYIKLESFCTRKETINSMKRQLSMGKDICKQHI